jgi:hypothetical protein
VVYLRDQHWMAELNSFVYLETRTDGRNASKKGGPSPTANGMNGALIWHHQAPKLISGLAECGCMSTG